MFPSSEIFARRTGTVSHGDDYEIMNTAHFLLNALEDELDFSLATNDATAGSFDDLVVETQDSKKEIICLQLKHLEKKSTLTKNELESSKGNFSILKYLKSYENQKTINSQQGTLDNATHLMLFTNKSFNQDSLKLRISLKESEKLKEQKKSNAGVESKYIVVRIYNKTANKYLNTAGENGCCYGFEFMETSVNDKDMVNIYKEFFFKFYLYSNQLNCKELENKVKQKFKKLFSEEKFHKFILDIKNWCMIENTKVEKLNKNWMLKYFSILLFFDQIRTFNFAATNGLDEKQKLFKEIISKFNAVYFKEESYELLTNIWTNLNKIIESFDIKEISKILKCFNIEIKEPNVLDDRIKSFLLWVLADYPLIVIHNSNFHKSMKYFSSNKIIFLTKEDENVVSNSDSFNSLQNLNDLKATSDLEKLLTTFSFFTHKGELFLKDFIGNDKTLMKNFSTDILLQMTYETVKLDGFIKTPLLYQKRLISFHTIQDTFFKKLTSNCIIAIDEIDNIEKIKKSYFRNCFSKFEFININSEKIDNLDCKKLYVLHTKDKIQQTDYENIMKKNQTFKQFHKFSIRKDKKLEWNYSYGTCSEIANFIDSDLYEPEELIWENQNKINLLTDKSGMGKSEFLKHLSRNCRNTHIPILLNSKSINQFLQYPNVNQENIIEKLKNFLLNNFYKTSSSLFKEILNFCFKVKRIIFLWDGLDEMTEKNLKFITNLIEQLSKENYQQWITCRSHLQSEIEKRFNIFARHLKEFSEQEQTDYFKKNLRLSDGLKVKEIINKVLSNFRLIEHKNILGIPLLISMVTEIVNQNEQIIEKFQCFNLASLYHFFIKEKLKIFENKLRLRIQEDEEYYELIISTIKNKHTETSLKAILDKDVLKELNHKNGKLFKPHCIAAGIIADLSNEDNATFIHNSFAEYFVALFFFENRNFNNVLKKFIFEEKFTNVRYFYDLSMAGDSVPHLAILNKNFDQLKKLDDEALKNKDKGGRNLLHLLSSWSQYHEPINVNVSNSAYCIQHYGKFNINPDRRDLKAADFLLTKCECSELDNLFQMSPLDYATQCCNLPLQIKLYLKNSEKIDKIDNKTMINMLYYASAFGYDDVIYLFEKKFQKHSDEKIKVINSKNSFNQNFVSVASERNNCNILIWLLKQIVQIDYRDVDGRTPLSKAVENGYLDIAKYLVECGADVNCKNKYGYTPLYRASLDGHLEFAKYLVDCGADVNCKNKYGYTPLYITSQNGYLDFVKYLVECGADVNCNDQYGYTPLYIASQNGHFEVVKYLIECGADVNCKNEYGNTPLNIAFENGHYVVFKYLVECGADITITET